MDRRRLGMGKPITHEEFIKAKEGNWNVVLTPTKIVPHNWFGDLKGKKYLDLPAAEGNRCLYSQHLALSAQCLIILRNSLRAKNK